MIGNYMMLTDFVELFELEVLHRGGDFETAKLTISDVNRPGIQLLGFYDYFDPRRLQVIGMAENAYLTGLDPQQRNKCFNDLFSYDIPALVIARGMECLPECMENAEKHGRTILRTKETTVAFTSRAIGHLNQALAPCITRHGVLMEMYGVGVMIVGDSGVGKSETAIELVMRGHRLVADDAVEIRRISNELVGTAPEVIRHYMELRGIGVISVRQLFGIRSVKKNGPIDLIVHLEPWDDEKQYDRLGLEEEHEDILGIPVSTVTIPVRPGRNLAAIVEVAALNMRNHFFGYNAAKELAERVDMQIDFGTIPRERA